nr:DUF3313 family protein [uncultured Rhodopila sp.]
MQNEGIKVVASGLVATSDNPGGGSASKRLACINGIGLAAAAGLLLAACTPPGTRALDAGVPLAQAPDLAGAAPTGSVIWRSPDLGAAEHAASAYLIPPATVYRGRGSYFADLSPSQVDQIAAMLTKDVRTAIGRRFRVVDAPGPGVFTVELILVNVTPPRPAYVTSGPRAVSALAVGMPEAGGTTAGTMTVAGKFLDSQTGKMLVAFSSPLSPTVMDLSPPGNPARALDFAEAASEQFASDLVRAIVRQRQNTGALPPG